MWYVNTIHVGRDSRESREGRHGSALRFFGNKRLQSTPPVAYTPGRAYVSSTWARHHHLGPGVRSHFLYPPQRELVTAAVPRCGVVRLGLPGRPRAALAGCALIRC
jgi:hypothetical protein